MRKNIISIAFIAAALLAASCQKENIQESATPDQDAPQFTASIESCGNTKTTVERVTTPSIAYKTYWESTDLIKINGATYQAAPDGTDKTKATFTMTEGTAPSADYHAYFPASIYDGSTATLPTTYTYDNYTASKYNMPMYAESSTTSLSFKNLCGILAITVPSTQMTKVTSISITSDQRMNGAFTATAAGVLTFASSAATDADKKVTLSFTNAKTIENSVTFYIPVPAGTHNPLTINVSDGTLMKTMVTKKSGGVEISRNVVYPITFADNQLFILSGLFSVSATKQVRFSKGNLYYNGSEWYFEDNQYDYRTYAGKYSCISGTKSDTGTPTNHWGTFGWSTSSTTYGMSTSNNSSSYNGNFVDWGKNAIANGGNTGDLWKTLSSAEWDYLISKRTVNGGTGEGKLYQRTTLTLSDNMTTVYGLILVPDNYKGSFSSNTLWSDWQTMESAGCVFLPAAGYRSKSDVKDVGSYSYYWSSTSSGDYGAYYFDSNAVWYYITYRDYGYSVRLVSTVTE